MKLTAATFVAIAGVASAATITSATTGSGGDITGGSARAVYDTSGSALGFGTGFVGVGFFTSAPNFATDSAATIEGLFSQLGSSGTMGLTLGTFSIDGLFSIAASDGIGGGNNDEFIGQNIITVIGNGNSIAASTELLVVSSATTFAADAPSFTASVNFQTGDGTSVLFGSNSYDASGPGGEIIPGQAFTGASNSYQTAALVPEPSMALLGALGVLGLLRRRR